MSAQRETWWEAWLGLLGLGDHPPGDWSEPCCRYVPDDQRSDDSTVICRYTTDCDY